MRLLIGTGIADTAPALGLWMLSLAYLLAAYQYPPASRAFPVIVAWSMLVLVTLDVIARTPTRAGRAVTRWLNPASAVGPDGRIATPTELLAILWVVGFVTALVLIGILYAVPLFVFASVRWRGKQSYWISLVLAGGTTLFVWLLFARLLRIDLYSGLLGGG
jgi:hypothetical protein